MSLAFPQETENLLKIVFNTADVRDTFLRIADPALLNVLSWLVRPETRYGEPPFMHDFPDAPDSMSVGECRGFVDHYLLSTLFNKDYDALKNDIVFKSNAFREFYTSCRVLFHQNYENGCLRDTKCFFLKTFMNVFREAWMQVEKKNYEWNDPMLINFDQSQSVHFSDIEEDSGLQVTVFADAEKIVLGFNLKHECQIYSAFEASTRIIGVPLEGHYALCVEAADRYYFQWMTPKTIKRFDTWMAGTEKDGLFTDFLTVCDPFIHAWLGWGEEEHIVQFKIEDEAQEVLFEYRDELTKLQYGGVIPVPPPGFGAQSNQ